jgi:hypothetical protein
MSYVFTLLIGIGIGLFYRLQILAKLRNAFGVIRRLWSAVEKEL